MNVQNKLENEIAMVTGRWMKVYNHKMEYYWAKKGTKTISRRQ